MIVDQKTFLSHPDASMPDEMLRWASQLEALGSIIYQFSWHNDEILKYKGEDIGSMIKDYATAIHAAIELAYWPISNFYEQHEDSLSAELIDTLEKRFVNRHVVRADKEDIEEALTKIEAFQREAKKISEIKRRYEKLRADWKAEYEAESLCNQ